MKIVFATNNLHKLSELKNMLPDEIELLSLADIDCHEDLPETQNTLKGNAMQKAAFVYEHYGYNCFADDTGLEIEALNKEPGVYSARYAGLDCSADDNIKKVLLQLHGESNRVAQFITVIALIIDGKEHYFEGLCYGEIVLTKQGQQGFGYDPIFKPDSSDITFAEMSSSEKGQVSHRGIATKKLVAFLIK